MLTFLFFTSSSIESPVSLIPEDLLHSMRTKYLHLGMYYFHKDEFYDCRTELDSEFESIDALGTAAIKTR